MKPILVIHGGAGSGVPKGEKASALAGSLAHILSNVFPHLHRGSSAVEAVTRAVELLENDPLYNAGLGSKIQSDGHIRLSAALMDGYGRRFGACVNVERVRNPVRLAEACLGQSDRVLSEKGGETLARELGLEFKSPFTRERRAEFAQRLGGRSGTVGAVALDRKGRLAAATSTGGRGNERPHRVSDTPTVAGCFANRHCAVSATGIGEEIVEFAVCSRLASLVEAGIKLDKADRDLLRQARRARARFGWIALNSKGLLRATTATEHLIWAYASPTEFEVNP